MGESIDPGHGHVLRVLIADDHRLVIAGLRAALYEDDGIEVVGEASTGRSAVELARTLEPDLVLLDLRMPDGDGMWALRELREVLPEVRVIVLSMYDDHDVVDSAIGEGATGYIVKSIDPRDLSAAIRQTMAGTVFTAGAVIDPRGARVAASRPAGITERELEALRLVAEGLSNAQIARRLWVTEQTIKFHLSNVYRKLGVSNRTEASRWAQRQGLLTSAPPSDSGT
jgi:DNA-binding NarL/FixJ family response regulator